MAKWSVLSVQCSHHTSDELRKFVHFWSHICFMMVHEVHLRIPSVKIYSAKTAPKKGMIQEIFNISFFIKIFICIQVNNHHTLYQYVTERHPKNKISGFLTGSIHSLWLSQNNTIYTENGERYEYNGWNNYWWVDLLFVACKLLLLPPALSSVLSRCFSASFLIAAWTLPSPPTSSSF